MPLKTLPDAHVWLPIWLCSDAAAQASVQPVPTRKQSTQHPASCHLKMRASFCAQGPPSHLQLLVREAAPRAPLRLVAQRLPVDDRPQRARRRPREGRLRLRLAHCAHVGNDMSSERRCSKTIAAQSQARHKLQPCQLIGPPAAGRLLPPPTVAKAAAAWSQLVAVAACDHELAAAPLPLTPPQEQTCHCCK
jgi:hypothetical protein